MRISVRLVGITDYVQVVDLAELGRFRFRRTGHAGKFLVHAEIVLKGDRGQGLIFALDLDAFFGFHGLVQSVGPAASGHLASGEFVDDDHFAVFHDVVDVALVERVRAQRLVDVVNQSPCWRDRKGCRAQQAFALADAFFGERRGAMLFVERVIDVLGSAWE